MLIIIILMAFIAFGTFSLILFLLKRKLLIEYMQSPPGIQCDTFEANINQLSTFQLAYKEELEWRKIDIYSYDLNVVTSRKGALSCLCAKSEREGDSSSKLFTVKDSNG